MICAGAALLILCAVLGIVFGIVLRKMKKDALEKVKKDYF